MKFIQENILQDASDDSLIRKYKSTGELDYLAALYQRYMGLVYGVCLKYFDEESSKDAVMLIFEELIQKLKQHEVQNFKSWLHVLTRNHCLMKIRSAKNKESLVITGHPVMESGEIQHHENGNNLEDNLQAMEKCLETLPVEQKESVNLFYLQEKSYREIVSITGYEMNKVKSYIQNGKRNLKNCMDKQHGQ
ncbi:RNA polymerase subunit sigma-70 [Chitinophaga caeni]|uniref:RNA polymerase subunit sigma-70 n=1 Tax=Chitinophaga caeni TaxID=2029983 RepID=A0A291QS12_9BACT|nr:sigma-70 family RNA polymerase sigma factor [Chitinophaga caeni]ATL46799.1 RNA polymerase subunit sigma-70 [Chitinophaga caeni]